jgi:hypothetical protein
MSLSEPRLKRAVVTFLLHERGGIAIDAARSGEIRRLAGVAELVDAPDLGSGDANHGGSIPSARTSSTPSRDCDLSLATGPVFTLLQRLWRRDQWRRIEY